MEKYERIDDGDYFWDEDFIDEDEDEDFDFEQGLPFTKEQILEAFKELNRSGQNWVFNKIKEL